MKGEKQIKKWFVLLMFMLAMTFVMGMQAVAAVPENVRQVDDGETATDCYNNWSSVVEIVTRPDKLDRVKFTGADDKTVTLKWNAATGANLYYVEYNSQKRVTKTNSIRLTYVPGASTATVVPARSTADGSYVAERKAD